MRARLPTRPRRPTRRRLRQAPWARRQPLRLPRLLGRQGLLNRRDIGLELDAHFGLRYRLGDLAIDDHRIGSVVRRGRVDVLTQDDIGRRVLKQPRREDAGQYGDKKDEHEWRLTTWLHVNGTPLTLRRSSSISRSSRSLSTGTSTGERMIGLGTLPEPNNMSTKLSQRSLSVTTRYRHTY